MLLSPLFLGNEKIVKHNLHLIKKDNIGMIGNDLIKLNDIKANFKSYKFSGRNFQKLKNYNHWSRMSISRNTSQPQQQQLSYS